MFRLTIPVVYMLCIFLLSSIPGDASQSIPTLVVSLIPSSLQNLLHIPLFAGLGLSWIWALNPTQLSTHKKTATLLVICISFAIFDELHQLNVPGRYGSLSDLMLDILGIISALMLQFQKPFVQWLRI